MRGSWSKGRVDSIFGVGEGHGRNLLLFADDTGLVADSSYSETPEAGDRDWE